MSQQPEWKFEHIGEFYASVARGGVEVEFDGGTSVSVRIVEGHGFCAASSSADISVEALAQVLRHFGYVVERRG